MSTGPSGVSSCADQRTEIAERADRRVRAAHSTFAMFSLMVALRAEACEGVAPELTVERLETRAQRERESERHAFSFASSSARAITSIAFRRELIAREIGRVGERDIARVRCRSQRAADGDGRGSRPARSDSCTSPFVVEHDAIEHLDHRADLDDEARLLRASRARTPPASVSPELDAPPGRLHSPFQRLVRARLTSTTCPRLHDPPGTTTPTIAPTFAVPRGIDPR